jgi:hypothetical protein
VKGQVIGWAQTLLSVLFCGGYFIVLTDFIHGGVHAGAEWHDAIQTLLSLLTAGVLTILHFWFSRSRAASGSDPDPPQNP